VCCLQWPLRHPSNRDFLHSHISALASLDSCPNHTDMLSLTLNSHIHPPFITALSHATLLHGSLPAAAARLSHNIAHTATCSAPLRRQTTTASLASVLLSTQRSRGSLLPPLSSTLRFAFFLPLSQRFAGGRGLLRDTHAALLPVTLLLPEAPHAFKISMTHWVLQFALRIAFRWVLHRCRSPRRHVGGATPTGRNNTR